LDLRAGTVMGDPRQKDDCNKFRGLQWNADDLKQAKKSELHKTLEDEETNVFVHFKLLLEKSVKYFLLKNYPNFLPNSRQIASGILIGTHKTMKHIFNIAESMKSTRQKLSY
jgi:hypothetical protein